MPCCTAQWCDASGIGFVHSQELKCHGSTTRCYLGEGSSPTEYLPRQGCSDDSLWDVVALDIVERTAARYNADTGMESGAVGSRYSL